MAAHRFFLLAFISRIPPALLLYPRAVAFNKGRAVQQQREENVFPAEGGLPLEDLVRLFVIILFTFLVQYTFHFLICILSEYPLFLGSVLVSTVFRRGSRCIDPFYFYITYSNVKFSFHASVVC